MNRPSRHSTRRIPLVNAPKFMFSIYLFLVQTKTTNKGPPLPKTSFSGNVVNYGVLFTFLPYLSNLSASI